MRTLRCVDRKFRQQVKFYSGSPDEDDDRKWMEKERLHSMAAHYGHSCPMPRKYIHWHPRGLWIPKSKPIFPDGPPDAEDGFYPDSKDGFYPDGPPDSKDGFYPVVTFDFYDMVCNPSFSVFLDQTISRDDPSFSVVSDQTISRDDDGSPPRFLKESLLMRYWKPYWRPII